MPLYFPPFDTNEEPNEFNMKNWMDNLYAKYEPIEQARWNQSNIDTLFYAGEQRFINSYFNFFPNNNFQNFNFNLVQQPINMVTGYQRQHRKSLNYLPVEGSIQKYADDLTKLEIYANNYRNRLEKLSSAYEQSAIAGMVLIQPYLDFNDDPLNGTLDIKIWPYNSFMCDAYFRDPLGEDSNFWWCQQYVSKPTAMEYFPERAEQIKTMQGYGGKSDSKFYFLPENYNLVRNELLVLSYIWYKHKRKKTMLYNHQDGLLYDFYGNEEELDRLLSSTQIYDPIQLDVPSWKVAVVLNSTLMYQGYNPLGFDESPLIPVYWNYDAHVAQYDLRVRSLTRAMRSSQFLLNRRVVINHDISESSINTGFIRLENAIQNEDDLKYTGQGKDIIINSGFGMDAIQKIVPNAVPQSDMELANQLTDFIFKTSGVNQELMGMAQDSKTGIQEMLRQGAGLVTLQKYFDQWDMVLKQLGFLDMKIMQKFWSYEKVKRIIGDEPSIEFKLKVFGKYSVQVAEGLNTVVQQQQQFAQLMELHQIIPIPAKFLLKYSTIQGKEELLQFMDQQEQQQAEVQKQAAMLEQNKIEAQIQNLNTKSVADIAMARERHGRAESNIGLFEERLSEISQNRSQAVKAKMEAVEKFIEILDKYGEVEAKYAEREINEMSAEAEIDEDREKVDAKLTSQSNDFLTNVMQNNENTNNMKQSPQL